jgi:hypothetical protein
MIYDLSRKSGVALQFFQFRRLHVSLLPHTDASTLLCAFPIHFPSFPSHLPSTSHPLPFHFPSTSHPLPIHFPAFPIHFPSLPFHFPSTSHPRPMRGSGGEVDGKWMGTDGQWKGSGWEVDGKLMGSAGEVDGK